VPGLKDYLTELQVNRNTIAEMEYRADRLRARNTQLLSLASLELGCRVTPFCSKCADFKATNGPERMPGWICNMCGTQHGVTAHSIREDGRPGAEDEFEEYEIGRVLREGDPDHV